MRFLRNAWILVAVLGVQAFAAAPEGAGHWAFQRPEPIAIPAGANPVDFILGRKLAELGLDRQKPAPKDLWLRRVHLDLTGLPPHLDALEAFCQDASPETARRVVDSLLASPRHGEHWGRHWMDVWRYSDWYGLGDQLRYSQKHIWHWRDWIVESLNDDEPYSRMIVEMLAGDELVPGDLETVRATGFLARNYFLFNRTTWLDATIEHTNRAFLGLTMQCAKCHDHKYDPVTHEDYYRMRAIFEPHQVRLDQVPGQIDLEKDGIPRVFDDHIEAKTPVHRMGNEADPDDSRVMEPAIPSLLGELEIVPVSLPRNAYAPGTREYVRADHLGVARRSLREAEQTLEKTEGEAERAAAVLRVEAAELRLEALKARIAADDDPALTKEAAEKEDAAEMLEAQWAVADAELRVQAGKEGAEDALKKARERLETVEKQSPQEKHTPLSGSQKALETPEHTFGDYAASYSPVSTGRRLAFARWIADRENPLTARVAVNHVWLRLMGRPLVQDVTDFGMRSDAPLHQDLLDHLACEFMSHDWSFKWLIQTIVTSELYGTDSSMQDAELARARDPENRHYWRMNAKRMQAQSVRDATRWLADALDLRMGGPSLDTKGAEGSPRRSLYFKHSRDDEHRFLVSFDDASVVECYRREESVAPQQALALVNDANVYAMASRLAARWPETVNDPRFVEEAFQLVIGRKPGADERAVLMKGLHRFAKAGGDEANPRRVRTHLVMALFNHNDFITIR